MGCCEQSYNYLVKENVNPDMAGAKWGGLAMAAFPHKPELGRGQVSGGTLAA